MDKNSLPRYGACLSCRQKKHKCDGIRPTCASCVKFGKECVFDERAKTKREQLDTYIRYLEDEIRRLESGSSSSGSREGNTSPLSVFLRTDNGQSRPYEVDASSNGVFRGSPPQTGTVVPGAGGMVWNPPQNYSPTSFSQEIPSMLRESFVRTFLQNRDKCCVDLHAERFIQALSLPSTDPRAPHPALVQAVLLTGCYLPRLPELVDHEARLLAQTRHELSASLQNADRLLDFIRASNLVAFYYFCRGMYDEAYRQIGHSARTVISCRMHQIPTSVWRPATLSGDYYQSLAPPADNVDLGERIHVFWQTACFDMLFAMVAGQSAQLANGSLADPALQVGTPWPRLISDYEKGQVSDLEVSSVPHLFDTRLFRYIRPETLTSLRVQGLCLAQHAQHLSNTSVTQQDVLHLDNVILDFIEILPGLRNTGEMGEIPAVPGASSVNHRIALIRTLSYFALITLFQHGRDATARQRVQVATREIVAIIGQLVEEDYPELFILGHIWYLTCEILIHIYHASAGSIREQIYRDLVIVLKALKRLGIIYLVLGFQVQQLEALLASPSE